MADNAVGSSSTDEGDTAGASSADNHAFQEQKKRLRLTSPENEINMDEFKEWTFSNHHRSIVHLLSCLAGIEVWTTSKTSKFNLEQRLIESYRR